MKRIDRYLPPGLDRKRQRKILLWGIACAVLCSIQFLMRFFRALDALYLDTSFGRVLDPSRLMPDFDMLAGSAGLIFRVAALALLIFFLCRFLLYYWHGSKSIYLMRRLSDRWELARRCLIYPVMAALLCLAVGFAVLLLYFGIYMLVTPGKCLMPGQWQKLWRAIL